MKGFVLSMLVGAVIFLFLVSCDVDVYTVVVEDPSATTSVATPALPAQRTPEEAQWIARVNGECARRNAKALGLRPPMTPSQLASYSRRLFAIYREHTSRIVSLPRPTNMTAAAAAIGQAETSKLRALDRVRRSAGALDVPGAKKEIRRFTKIARDAAPQLVELDLPECARYQ